jgi:hypothetical protein
MGAVPKLGFWMASPTMAGFAGGTLFVKSGSWAVAVFEAALSAAKVGMPTSSDFSAERYGISLTVPTSGLVGSVRGAVSKSKSCSC